MGLSNEKLRCKKQAQLYINPSAVTGYRKEVGDKISKIQKENE